MLDDMTVPTEFFDPLIDQLKAYWVEFLQLLPQLVLAAVVLLITWGLVFSTRRVITRVFGGSKLRPALVELMRLFAGLGVWLVGILLAATIAFPSVTPAQMIGTLGLGGVAIGLAFKDTLENFVSGVMIMARKPMQLGDVIEVDDVEGRVEEITIRDTYIRKLNNELVLVPNAQIYKNKVNILTDRPKRRYDIVVGVAYGEDAAKAREVIEGALKGLSGIDANLPVEVYAREFNASSIDFTVRWWAGSSPVDMHRSRSAVVIAIKEALDKAGIEIPFPYRTLTFKGPVPFAQEEASDEDNPAP
jgi:small conductance mechanosensitive channel